MEQRGAVERAFDRVGGSIEAKAIQNPVVAWMRATSRREELARFPPGSRLLEVGCGSGADAVFFARHGRPVVAIDVSAEMVATARQSAGDAGVENLVQVECGDVGQLRTLLESLPGFPVDGAYANFSLAYEPSLREVASNVHRLLRPGARFLFTVPNRICLSELASLGSRLKFGTMARRWSGSMRWTIRGIPIRLSTYSPKSVVEALRGLFRLRRYQGVPVFMPPPLQYSPVIDSSRRVLEALDNMLDTRFPWNLLGDETLFDFERLPNA